LKPVLKSHPIGSILVGTVAVFFLIDFAYGVYLQNYEISGYTKYNKAYEEHSAIFSGPFSFYIAVLGRYTGAHIQDIGVALTAVATVVMAVFTGRLWFSTEKLWGEAKATSEIANRSAKAAEDTVLKMEDTAKKELRAYLGVIRGHIEMYSAIFGTSKTRYKVFVDIANSGQTPAKNVRRAVDAKLLTQIIESLNLPLKITIGSSRLMGLTGLWSKYSTLRTKTLWRSTTKKCRSSFGGRRSTKTFLAGSMNLASATKLATRVCPRAGTLSQSQKATTPKMANRTSAGNNASAAQVTNPACLRDFGRLTGRESSI